MNFIGRAYLNRRFTRLIPSCVLAALIGGIYLVVAIIHAGSQPGSATAVDLVVVAFEALLFPFAREIYFRLTWPLRSSMPVLIVPLPVLGAFYVGKAVMFVVLVSVTIPLGIVGFIFLGLTEHRGSGYRLD